MVAWYTYMSIINEGCICLSTIFLSVYLSVRPIGKSLEGIQPGLKMLAVLGHIALVVVTEVVDSILLHILQKRWRVNIKLVSYKLYYAMFMTIFTKQLPLKMTITQKLL